jgi:homoisocitrate dehydrogenase
MTAGKNQTICLIPGDGIGKEVIAVAAELLAALGLGLRFVEAPAGYEHFRATGDAIPDSTLAEVASAQAALFGATSSPSDPAPGYHSPILVLRRTFDLYANLRPVFSLPGRFSRRGVNLLIVRENTEDLYAGRERLEGDTAIAERVITRSASERIAQAAFDFALVRSRLDSPASGSLKTGSLMQAYHEVFELPLTPNPCVTIVHKANVLKLTDGLFRKACLEIAAGYPAVAVKEMLVDAAAMRLAANPEGLDVVVTTNMFGDILSDEASALVGGLGVAPSANLGARAAVFEPVHGSAPDIVGLGIANPVGALLSAVMLLEYIHQPHAARRLARAIQLTLAEGILTPDLGGKHTTAQVTQAALKHLGPE